MLECDGSFTGMSITNKIVIIIFALILSNFAHAEKRCGSSQDGFYFLDLVDSGKLDVVSCRFEITKSGAQRSVVEYSNSLTLGLMETGGKSELVMIRYKPKDGVMYSVKAYQIEDDKQIPLIEFRYGLSDPVKFLTLPPKDYSAPVRKLRVKFNDGITSEYYDIVFEYRMRVGSY